MGLSGSQWQKHPRHMCSTTAALCPVVASTNPSSWFTPTGLMVFHLRKENTKKTGTNLGQTQILGDVGNGKRDLKKNLSVCCLGTLMLMYLQLFRKVKRSWVRQMRSSDDLCGLFCLLFLGTLQLLTIFVENCFFQKTVKTYERFSYKNRGVADLSNGFWDQNYAPLWCFEMPALM